MAMDELYALYLEHPSVQTDTRKLQKGDLFFALKGPNFNGNSFVKQALEMGAACCIIDEEAYAVPGKTFLVADVLEALQNLAKHHRNRFPATVPVIGVTGSNGKTTTKELLNAVLSTTFRTYTTEGNLNNHIGVPLTILRMGMDVEVALIEMGANHLGEIASYCTIANPTHGLITNCGKAHLEGFGSEEGVRKGKGELFDHLRNNGGTAFLMKDYDYLMEMAKGIPNQVTYGTKDATYTGDVLHADPFLVVAFGSGFQGNIATQLVGHYNLPNVLAAVSVGSQLGVSQANIKEAIENYSPSNSRSQLVQRGTNKIILDAYNANPSSMKLAIENFAATGNGKKYLVLGAMAELGEHTAAEHRDIIASIDRHQWEAVLLVGPGFEGQQKGHHWFASAAEAGEWLNRNNVHDAFMLIKGSRSTGMEKVLDHL